MAIRARCVVNSVQSLNPRVRERVQDDIHIQGPIDGLVIGRVYEVLGLEDRNGGIWIFIQQFVDSAYPHPCPIEMFEMLDASVPPGWCVAFEMQPDGRKISRITFREWAEDDTFYERLVDGDASALEAYTHERRRLSKPL